MREPTQVSDETRMFGKPNIIAEYMDVDEPSEQLDALTEALSLIKVACARAAQEYMLGTIETHGFRSDFAWATEDCPAVVLTIHGFDAEDDVEDWSFHVDLGVLVDSRVGEGEEDTEVRSENVALAASLRALADKLDGREET